MNKIFEALDSDETVHAIHAIAQGQKRGNGIGSEFWANDEEKQEALQDALWCLFGPGRS